MERSEPSLVPEWLRSTGSGPGGGISNHQFASSHSGRSLSSYSRRSSSSNGLAKHDKNYSRSYNSFNRNHRERDKERSVASDHWDLDYSDPLRNIMSGRIEKDTLRRSQSMVSRMHGEVFPRRVSTDWRGGSLSNNEKMNEISVGVTAGIQKVSFEKDFPSLGSEERPATPELCRVPSPRLSSAVQSIPMVNSAMNTGDSWTSALAEVPTGIAGNNTGSSLALQPAALASGIGGTATAGLNMADALVQSPLRSPSSQTPAQNQRFEELAFIQSKRLIPMTPSMPKSSVLNPSDKLKPKTAPRSNEPAVMPKNGNIRAEGLKTSVSGKLLVLKSGRENGVPPVLKDIPSPAANANNKHVTVQSSAAPAIAPILSKTPTNSKLAGERKAQAQSRTDFFNSVRKKSMNSTPVSADSRPFLSSAIVERLDALKDVASAPVSLTTKNSAIVKCNGDATTTAPGFLFTSDEEQEFAFMRSLGWEPDSGVDEGLTTEEITEFCKKYKKVIPTLKRCQVVKRLAPKLEETSLDGASSE
ncbi:hypothetical protein Dimus_025468 [Dionaea muscipula]